MLKKNFNMKDDNEHDEDENTIRHGAGIISLGILAVIVAIIALAAVVSV